MGVRFILGRAGSGKTHYCLQSMATALRDECVDSPRAILLVPEQASQQSERALLQCGIEGTFRGAVLSFRRLAVLLMQLEPPKHRKVITPIGRVMTMQRLLREHRGTLRFFVSSRIQPGLARQLTRQIEEFVQAGLQPHELIVPQEPPALSAKMHDLQRLFAEYLALLNTGFVDPALHLDTARNRLADSGVLSRAHVWVDGFAGFTQQELRLLVEIAKCSAHTEIALLTDPAICARDDGPPAHAFGLFAPTLRSYDEIAGALRDANLNIDAPLRLDHRPGRFEGHADLAHLERELFAGRTPYATTPSSIEVCQAADPRGEVAWTVRRIRDLVACSTNPLRYREIAVVTRRIEDFADALSMELRAHDIPFFLDRRVPLAEHPLCAFLRDLLRAGLDGFSTATMRSLLKSSVMGLRARDSDPLENYLLMHAISDGPAWRSDWQFDPDGRFAWQLGESQQRASGPILQRLNAAREAIAAMLGEWLDLAPDTTAVGEDWARKLYDVVVRCSVPRRLEGWARKLDQDGAPVDAQHHRAAWACTVELLEDFTHSMGSVKLTYADFCTVLTAGLDQADVGLAPPALDQVVVGSIERSRHMDIKAAFLLGLNDGCFPGGPPEATLINDAERKLLIDSGLGLAAPRTADLGEERLLAYIAMTRASERLCITCSQADESGRALSPSSYLLEVAHVLQCKIAPHAEGRLADVSTASQLVEALAEQLINDDTADADTWRGLYNAARQRPNLVGLMRSGLAGLADHNATVDVPVLSATRTASISELRSYAQCPFQHYASKRLRLQRRRRAGLDVLQLGTIVHEALDRLSQGLLASDAHLANLQDSELRVRIDQTVAELCDAGPHPLRRVDPFLTAALTTELTTALHAHRSFLAAGQTRVLASERHFGFDDANWPAISLETPAGRTLLIRGKIDRIDGDTEAGFVYDYKRSKETRFSMLKMYHGLDMQLPAYLLALKQSTLTLHPAGAFFLPLVPDVQIVDHPDAARKHRFETHRPRGLHDTAFTAALHGAKPEATTAVANDRDGLASKVLAAVLSQVETKAGELADGILDGKIAVAPYELRNDNPCRFCDFRAACRVDRADGGSRPLEDLSPKEVLARLSRHG
jgi:ATP-dependent helicase/nuclease subunit B